MTGDELIVKGEAITKSGKYKPPIGEYNSHAPERDWDGVPVLSGATTEDPPDDDSPGEPVNRAELPDDGAFHQRVTDCAMHADPPTTLAGMRDGAWLDAQEFPPLEYAVPGVIPEGLGVLAGPPKLGKSWFVSGVALASAVGGKAVGRISVAKRPVLYQALEDGDRRLQARWRHIMGGQPIPVGINYITRAESSEVVFGMICEFLQRHRDGKPLIILDTLGKVKPPRPLGADPYQFDYRVGSQLKAAVDKVPGATLLVVHHTRKAESPDFIDSVSGTQGIAGSADFVLVLRRQRHSDDALLLVTGRDVTEAEYALKFTDGLWQLDGANLTSAASAAETRREKEHLGDRALEVLAFVNQRDDLTRAADLKVLGIDQEQARVYLNRLSESGRIQKIGRGQYRGVLRPL